MKFRGVRRIGDFHKFRRVLQPKKLVIIFQKTYSEISKRAPIHKNCRHVPV